MVNRLFALYSRLAEPFDNELAGILPDEKILSEMGKYTMRWSRLTSCSRPKGSMRARGACASSSPEGSAPATDGPYAETKELIAGFWLIQVKSKEEAILPQSVAAALAPPRALPRWPPGSVSGPNRRDNSALSASVNPSAT